MDEPPHVHIGKENREAKYWLEPIYVARSGRFKPVELHEIERIIGQHQSFLLQAWAAEQSKRAHS